ncbi:MAG: tRNA (adenosine(37)-N6)-dimethylallyltransferase MiaA [Desulfobulbaceae bacterium]|nr:tRNA (adenosine(37)-N6)-dimethylallyltransferase MiaA [Desulfobulbaceae bacterium]
MQFSAIAIIGPTGVGKTALSLAVAQRFGCEIVSVDSMQVYRYMDVGTAKATPEERALVPHHLLDVVDPDEEYNVARYIKDAGGVIDAIRQRGRVPLLVGGTGLYLRGLTQGLFEMSPCPESIRQQLRQRLEKEGGAALFAELDRIDPHTASRIHAHDTCRLLRGLEIYQATGMSWSEHLARGRQNAVLPEVLKIGLTWDREKLYERINRRVGQMVEEGLLAEVQSLLARGYGPELKSMQAIGYRHMVEHLRGEHDWQETLELLARDTRRYAKRQYTWFRRDESIRWFEPVQEETILQLIDKYLAVRQV